MQYSPQKKKKKKKKKKKHRHAVGPSKTFYSTYMQKLNSMIIKLEKINKYSNKT